MKLSCKSYNTIVIVNINDNNVKVVSHGIDVKTDRIVILPEVSPSEIGAWFN